MYTLSCHLMQSISRVRRVAYETQAQRKRRLEYMRECRLKMSVPVKKKKKSPKKKTTCADHLPKIAADHQG